MEYLSPQGVLLPLVYGTTASPLWLELRGHSAWQVTPSWTVYRLACHRLLPWLRVTFAMVPDPPGRARTTGLGVPLLPLARWVGWVAPVRPTHTYDFSSCFFPKFKIMHFQNRDIKLYTVVLLFLCFLKFLLKLCCR